MPYLIVGVDPGTTSAFAAVDLNGKLIASHSIRDGGIEKLIESIRKTGSVCIIASDKKVSPDSVAKISASFNSQLYLPAYDLTGQEKLALTKGIKFNSQHELDAAASAFKAYRFYENKLRHVNSVWRELAELKEKPKISLDEIKHLVLTGYRLSDVLLLEEIKEQGKKAVAAPASKSAPTAFASSAKAREYAAEFERNLFAIAELKKQVSRLSTENQLLLEKIKSHEKGISHKLERDSEVRRLNSKIGRLEEYISLLKRALFGKKHATEQKQSERAKQIELKLKKVGVQNEDELEDLVSDYRSRN
ncbi:Uncharacterised protein [Candidatus Gugararchaeum adminiculabundum]|nr:Uncharacterised protein [Candidatus Gugararchaeum adminiculabundum]